MIVVAHRRNRCEELRATPGALGVEVDVRLHHGRLVTAHDPLSSGEAWEDWLAVCRTQGRPLVIVHVKEEGLLPWILPGLDAIPAVVLGPELWDALRDRRVAVRAGDLHGIDAAIRLAEVRGPDPGWLWVDGFVRDAPLRADELAAVRARGWRTCVASPELYGRDPAAIDLTRAAGPWDAVCTRRPDRWA